MLNFSFDVTTKYLAKYSSFQSLDIIPINLSLLNLWWINNTAKFRSFSALLVVLMVLDSRPFSSSRSLPQIFRVYMKRQDLWTRLASSKFGCAWTIFQHILPLQIWRESTQFAVVQITTKSWRVERLKLHLDFCVKSLFTFSLNVWICIPSVNMIFQDDLNDCPLIKKKF